MKYDLEYLNSLISNKVEENLNLEYKSSASLGKSSDKTTEISKDVSAFANSDGGVIIYGISENKKNEDSPLRLDPVIKKDFSKEWLEQIINDKIRPRLDDVKIYPISIDDSTVVYIVEVAKSDTAHQAEDRKYYKRFNFQVVAMYDYEIRDILNRVKNPKLELFFGVDGRGPVLEIYIRNIGTILAKYVKVMIRMPVSIVSNPAGNRIVEHKFVEFSLSNIVKEIVNPYAAVVQYWPSRYEPLLPKAEFFLTKIQLTGQAFLDDNIIEWEIFCDNSTPQKYNMKMRDLINGS